MKFLLLFREAEVVFVIICFLNNFTLEYVSSMNSIWTITPASLLHVWVTKFKISLIFFELSILASNNVIWVGLLALLFNKAQHIVKTYTTGYVFYEVINILFFSFHELSMIFIKPQNLMLMGPAFFFICKLKGLHTTCKIFNFYCMQLITNLLPNMRKQHIKTVASEVFCLWLLT